MSGSEIDDGPSLPWREMNGVRFARFCDVTPEIVAALISENQMLRLRLSAALEDMAELRDTPEDHIAC